MKKLLMCPPLSHSLSLGLSLLAATVLSSASCQASALEPARSETSELVAKGRAGRVYAFTRLHVARSQGHTVTPLDDGRLLVLGGRSDNRATRAAELIDPLTGQVELLSSMVQARQGHAATLLPDGRVLVTGGDLGDGRVLAMSSAEIFDPVSKTFQALPRPMTLERSRHTATLLNSGKVLIAGGQGLSPAMVTFSAELFDPVSGSFESLAPQRLVAPRTYHAAALLASGQVLIVGGTDWQTLRAPTSAELYDPVRNTFTQLAAPLSFRNEMPQLITLGSGRVMVLNTRGADLFDPLSQTFQAIAGPRKARAYEAASALGDGGAVVLGGLSADAVTPTVERYDPLRGVFWSAGRLKKERAWGVAVLANHGGVLVIGGVDQGDAAIADVEVYWP